MLLLLTAFALVPFIASRTTLALGLALLLNTALLSHQHDTLSALQVVLSLFGAVGLIVLQLVVGSTRSFVDSWTETYRWATRAIDLFVTTVAGVAVAMNVLAREGQPAPIGWALAVGGATLGFALLREQVIVLFDVVAVVHEPNVKRAFVLTDVLSVLFGVGLAVALPWVGLVFATMQTVGLALVAWAMWRYRQASVRVCEGCSASVHGAASECPKCHSSRAPLRIGLLGRVMEKPASDVAEHRLTLLAARRCPSCAEPIVNHQGALSCPACPSVPFSDRIETAAFVAYTDKRMAAMVPAFAAMGFVPVLGLGAALLAYRLSPASAASGYVSWKERLGTRLIRMGALIGLSLLQPVPLLGALASVGVVSAMHVWTRQRFVSRESVT